MPIAMITATTARTDRMAASIRGITRSRASTTGSSSYVTMPPTMNGAAAGHEATVNATAPAMATTATIARPIACGVTVWSRSRRSTHWPAA